MTRVNAGIKPEHLVDQHLLAEHREIKRLCYNYTEWLRSQSERPSKFTMDTGHILFFVDKGEYTYKRYKLLHTECERRGFDVSDFSDNWDVYKTRAGYSLYYNDWIETQDAIELVQGRLVDRLSEMHSRYCGYKITFDQAINLLYHGKLN